MSLNQKYFIAVGTYVVCIFPVLVFAAPQLDTVFKPYISDIAVLIRLLVRLVTSLAVIFFLWGLVKFIFSAGDTSAQETGKNIMIWGTITIAVMVSFWGIVVFMKIAFGVS